MSDQGRFTPKLGRIGHRDSRHTVQYLQKRAKAARRGRLAAPRKHKLFPGQVRNLGRGAGVGAMAKHWSNHRQRRAIVKIHIARATALGARGFSAHLAYVQRDSAQPGKHKGHLYDRNQDELEGTAFTARSQSDSRQFRVIVSPEDGHHLADHKRFTRTLMSKVERDLGQRLDWVAANHSDTGHPHTHIIIRGGGSKSGEIIIAKDYITHGFRARAQEALTQELGQRRLREIALARNAAHRHDRWTAIDQDLNHVLGGGRTIKINQAQTPISRFDRTVYTKRLKHLKSLGLADTIGGDEWHLKPTWISDLKSLGRRSDIVRTLSYQAGQNFRPDQLHLFDPLGQAGSVTGRLREALPGDELRNGRLVIIDGIDGRHWSVNLDQQNVARLPSKGGIVTVATTPGKLKAADKTIATLAAANRGQYSDELHRSADPQSSAAFRLAHKRRLEALRRAGIVSRDKTGEWTIPADFETKVLKFESQRSIRHVEVQSYVPIETMINAQCPTWLDRQSLADAYDTASGFAAEVRKAKAARLRWLKDEDLWDTLSGQPNHPALERRSHQHLNAKLDQQAIKFAKQAYQLEGTETFEGTFVKTLDLPQGRYALIANDTHMLFAPANPTAKNWTQRRVIIKSRGKQLQWSLSRTRQR